jgi:hypothetical protein
MLGLIQHLQVTSVPIGDTIKLLDQFNTGTSPQEEPPDSWAAERPMDFYFNYKHYGRPDLKCGSHPQVKPIGIGWAVVSPLGLNAQPFLRLQGRRMGYTSELYQCGFEAIGFVCRKSTMMESLFAGDSSSCRWVVLVSPGFPF